MIAARIPTVARRGAQGAPPCGGCGRTFWSGAIEAIGEDSDPIELELQELVDRDFLVREPRSTIRAEEAFRFKHVLIRDVAYSGLPKSSRALLHRQMASWLHGPASHQLVEIRAYHLRHAAELEEELQGCCGRARRGGRRGTRPGRPPRARP